MEYGYPLPGTETELISSSVQVPGTRIVRSNYCYQSNRIATLMMSERSNLAHQPGFVTAIDLRCHSLSPSRTYWARLLVRYGTRRGNPWYRVPAPPRSIPSPMEGRVPHTAAATRNRKAYSPRRMRRGLSCKKFRPALSPLRAAACRVARSTLWSAVCPGYPPWSSARFTS